MIDILVAIPGPAFLLIYAALIVTTVLVGWLLVNSQTRGCLQPTFTQYTPTEIAYLRGGWKAVLQTVLHSLTTQGLVNVVGLLSQPQLLATGQASSSDKIEKLALRELREPTDSRDLFKDKQFGHRIEQLLTNERENLMQRRLLRNVHDRIRVWCVFCTSTLVLVAIAALKIWLGLQRDKPVLFLVLLAIVAVVALYVVIGPRRRQTLLGARYLRQLETHFAWLKSDSKKNLQYQGIDSSLPVAIFGLGAAAVDADLQCAVHIGSQWSFLDGGGGGGHGGCGGGCGGACGGGCGGGCGGCGG